MKYFDIQRVIEEKDVKTEIYCQKKKKTMILPSYMTAEYVKHPKSGYQCSETSINVFVFFTPHLHQRILFSHTSTLHWQKSVHTCSHLLQRQRFVEQFPEKEQVQS